MIIPLLKLLSNNKNITAALFAAVMFILLSTSCGKENKEVVDVSFDPEKSYTAKLFAEGPDSILKKIGEECAELIMAGKEGKRLKVVWESTDVIYHVLVLLAFYGLSIEDVSQEMRRREGISGIDEKASRGSK